MSEKIGDFLKLYPKIKTVQVYRAAIFSFLDLFYGRQRKGSRATKEEMARYEDLAEQYFNEGRNYFDDLLSFTTNQANRPPIPAKAAIAGVKEWLSFHGMELTQRELKQLANKRPRGNTGRTAELDIDAQMLRKILSHMDVKGKALILVLASSGMRIGEALAMDLSDVDLTTTPAALVVRGETTKTGDLRTVFISDEAKDAVVEWLKVRDSYLETATTRNKGLIQNGRASKKTIEDNRLFPFTDNNVREIWRNTLRRAQLLSTDNSTGLIQIRIHGLRKFFRSQLALSCPVDIVEALMGHEGYLTEAYRRFSRKQMAEYYLKAEHHITVMGAGDIKELSDKLQDTTAAVKGYKDIITEQAEEMVEIRRKMEERTDEIAKLREEIETMKRDGQYYQLAYDFVKLLSRDPTTTRRFSEFIEREKLKEKD